MKNIKEYLSEGLIRKQIGGDRSLREQILNWMKENCLLLSNGSLRPHFNEDMIDIRDNYKIDVFSNVYIKNTSIIELPPFIQFGKVHGHFSYYSNRKLKSLRGCPEWILKDFRVQDAKITSLKYGPEYVGGVFDCYGCKNLKNIDDFPMGQHRYDFMKTPFESEMGVRLDEECATPGNTMGMGNLVAPTETTPGSEPLTMKTAKTKKEKKYDSKSANK